MKFAFAGDIQEPLDLTWERRSAAPGLIQPAAAVAPTASEPPSRYGEEKRRPSLPAIAAIVGAHLALLAALVAFDVIDVQPKRNTPLVVTLVPEPVAPPPAAAPPEKEIKPVVEQVRREIVTPPPIVTVPAPAAPQVIAVAEAPPQATVATPAPPAPSAVPVPVTPPDGSAASLNNPSPKYPTESRRKREEGAVRLRVVITVEGLVKAIAVARSSGFERLDEAALDTVRKWKFKPGMQAGKPVEAIGFLVIPFKLKN